jgi:hypothetical protein
VHFMCLVICLCENDRLLLIGSICIDSLLRG